MKTQTVRLADVFFVGPVMVLGGWKLSDESPVLGGTLAVLGVLTVWYNGRNYLEEQRRQAVLTGSGLAMTSFSSP